MTTLRVLYAQVSGAPEVAGWALFDDAGRVLSRSREASEILPPADRTEAVIAAPFVRLVALKLPPLPNARRLGAARFALEDQLAAPSGELSVAVGSQGADGVVLAAITERSLLEALAEAPNEFERIVPEPALCPPRSDWVWCASGAGHGFVRLPDGSAFSVGAKPSDGVSPELVAALAQATKSAAAPAQLLVAERVDASLLERGSALTGVRFQAAQPWFWYEASPEMFDSAPDLRQGEFSRDTARSKRGVARLFRPALVIAAAALALHVMATIGEWAWLKVDSWRTSRSVVAVAADAGITGVNTSAEAATAVARRYAQIRHAAGLSAPADALPLLARAAPALARLPSSALKSATYADGAWTLEFGALDGASVTMLEQVLAAAGTFALHAPTAGGVRFRVTLPP